VLGRFLAASTPALVGCLASTTANQSCNGGTWTLNLTVVNGANTYPTLAAARLANGLAGANVTVTALGSIGLVPGFQTGSFGIVMPQIGVRAQAAMVIL
jgi:hypothetical protein